MKVLVVDDEPPIIEALTYSLKKEGFDVVAAGDAGECVDLVRSESPDIVVLDVMLPTASGFDVCRAIRRQSSVPIIMLTARAEEADRVVGLELGADDYMTKPFSVRELVARIKAILRRGSSAAKDDEPAIIAAGALVIDGRRHEVRVDEHPVSLSPKEYELLHFLASHPGQAFSRQAILDRVWGADSYVGDRTVDVHIYWLREKIETEPSQPNRLLTVRGLGYKFAEPSAAPRPVE